MCKGIQTKLRELELECRLHAEIYYQDISVVELENELSMWRLKVGMRLFRWPSYMMLLWMFVKPPPTPHLKKVTVAFFVCFIVGNFFHTAYSQNKRECMSLVNVRRALATKYSKLSKKILEFKCAENDDGCQHFLNVCIAEKTNLLTQITPVDESSIAKAHELIYEKN